MKPEAATWARYADENFQSAHVLLKNRLFKKRYARTLSQWPNG